MAFIYTGNHETTTLYGHEFPRGEAIELESGRIPHGLTMKFVVGKLSNNSHFEKVDNEKPVKKAGK